MNRLTEMTQLANAMRMFVIANSKTMSDAEALSVSGLQEKWEVDKVYKAATMHELTPWDVLSAPQLIDVSAATRTKLSRFVQMITNFNERHLNEDAYTLVLDIVSESGIRLEINKGNDPEDISRQENLQELLDEAENILKNEYNAARIDIVFHNPAHLPWIIPGSTDGHPCAPGIASESPAARLLIRRGYAEWCAQIAYYMPLSEYTVPEGQSERLSSLAQSGIKITYYDPARHRGLYELFDAIRNPGWRKTVMAHLDQPIVVAVDENADGLVIGYTGPLSQVREGDGIRGNFCGIGTHPDYRGRGIATLIFCEMCRHHSQHGATFMSLYTGENNPARRVYEAAGCHPAVRWSNLRLEFN